MKILSRNYHEESDEGYFLEVDVQYFEKLHELHDDTLHKVEKWVANLHDKTEYVIHIRCLKQPLSYRLVLKNVHD